MTAIATPASSPDTRVLLRNVSWETYESLLHELEGQHLRLAYDRGLLEIMSPSQRHGRIGRLVARLVETYTLEMDIPIVGLGDATWRRKAVGRGVEADECYYIAHAEWAASREELDLDVDPPPDLAIEVDITRSSLDKESIYAALGVPELWRHEDDRLKIITLGDTGKYESAAISPSLPDLTPAVIERFLKLRTSGKTDTQILAEFTAWVRSNPRQGG